MRIVGGKYKGRVLTEFAGRDIRPTSDMARESLFNILQFEIKGSSFLDLFCGTGAVGIEALSRGANKVTFNDADRKSIEVLKKNLAKLKVSEDYEVCNLDSITLLKKTTQKFDFIYIDPPYQSDLGIQALNLVQNCLEDNGCAIFEDQKPFEMQIEGLKITDSRKYGRIHLTFFKKGEK